MNQRRLMRALVMGWGAVLHLCGFCAAGEPLVAGDHSSETVYLESYKSVTTWEQEGTHVFVLAEGGVLRQGTVRLHAPRMVVWFDDATTESDGAAAAVVRVYAEGNGDVGERPDPPVRLAEGKRLRTSAALFMFFRSTSAFVWRCPLRKADALVYSSLYARAEALAADRRDEIAWDTIPEAADLRAEPEILQILQSTESHLFERDNAVVYLGDVRGTYGGVTVQADAAVVWVDQATNRYEMYAEGNVRLLQKPGVRSPLFQPGIGDTVKTLAADRVFINPGRGRVRADGVEVRLTDPLAEEEGIYVVRGKSMFMVDRNTFTVDAASVTTCPFAIPHYELTAARMQITRQDDKMPAMARDLRFRVGENGRTLLWLPFLGVDLARGSYLLTDIAAGSSTKFGAYVQTTWSPLDVIPWEMSWMDQWDLFVDHYTDRGTGLGSEIHYGFGPNDRHSGRLRGYYIADQGEEDDTGLPVPQTRRGRLHLEHRSQLSPAWRVDAEYYRISDSAFLNEYFESDFEEEKTPESYLLVRYLRNSTYLAVLYKEQVNDFLTQVTEKPSAALEVVGVPIGPFVYEGALRTGSYDLEFSDEFPVMPPDPPSLTRTHTDHKLSLPFSIWIFRIDPFARAVGTWATDSVGPNGMFAGSAARSLTGGGVNASTTFSRVFDVRNETFNLNQFRHVVIPHAGIERLWRTGDGSARFIQMDAHDALDEGTVGSIGLRNRLQTKRLRDGQWRSVNWMELDLTYVDRDTESVMLPNNEEFVRVDFEWLLTDRIQLHSRDTRIAADGGPNIINAGVSLEFSPRCNLSVDYDEVSGTNSTLSAELLLPLSDRYGLIVEEQYELDSRGAGEHKNLRTRVSLQRILDKWVFEIGVKVSETNDNVSLLVGFGPIGWGIFSNPRRAGW